jgi:vitamin B12 transporter
MFRPVRRQARSRALAAFCLLAAAGVSPAAADDLPAQPIPLPPLVVSATLLPTPQDQLGSSVTVITDADIERMQARTLPEVLQDVPGLNVVETGGPGGQTSVFMRGTNSNHTKVLVDGIDVSDPSSPNAAFDFSQFLASDIARVEVLRGPQSGLYGSDAIGGVIDIITKKGSGPLQFHASVEGGSFATFNQTAGASGSQGGFNYVFDFAHFHSGDTPVTPSDLVPPGRFAHGDWNDTKSYSTRLGVDVTDNFDLGLVAHLVTTDLHSTSDDFLGPETLPSDSDNVELFTRATAHLVLFDGAFDETAGIGYTDYRRRFFDPNAAGAVPSFYRGDRLKLDWHGDIKLAPGETLTLGAEHQLDQLYDSGPLFAEMSNNAGFVQLQSGIAERYFNVVSVRYDDNSRFGAKPTFRDAPAILIPETGTKLKGSVGTGFKAPSLDELFDNYPQFNFFANPNLRPETSLGYDLGFEQSLFKKSLQFGATYFHNDIRNLIDTNATFTSYANIGRATTYGAESFLAYRPLDQLSFRADYTYTFAEDDILHQELLRRPKHKASLTGTWQVTEAAALSATALYTGAWVDVNRAGTQSGLVAGGYTLVNLTGSYALGHGFTAFARVNNLLDRHYQNPIGFEQPSLGVFAGLRYQFNTAEASQ